MDDLLAFAGAKNRIEPFMDLVSSGVVLTE